MLSRCRAFTRVSALQCPKRNMAVSLERFGQHLFKGAVAEPYLRKHGLPLTVLNSVAWTTDGSADKVAAAVLDWARDHGASVYCHWFQPLGSSGFRHGQTGQVQNHMFSFDDAGKPVWKFDGNMLLKGETDGSSYPSGGLRATHRAGGYLSVDSTSPIFLRGDTIFIPSCLTSFNGESLDEKTPLLRAADALSREGVRLLKHLGYNVNSLQTNIGLEQEFFFVPRDAFRRRPDLQLAGRTVVGKAPPRGQELGDHYMAPPSMTSPALACMQEIQKKCFEVGIPLRTRHREVAPNQYEFAPMYGFVTTQIDQNLVVMQIMEEVASKHGLAVLLQEKPFQGVNGSGKHNNWSIGTDDGTNLLNVAQVTKNSGSSDVFPVVMAAILKAVNDHGDLMRLAVASPGNDFRLGACEAPPAIMSAYLGEDMTRFLDSYMSGERKAYQPASKTLHMGASALPPIQVPAEDRNRTSPFPYGGHRFEFRAVGSSQNVSLVNTILATIVANSFAEFADAIEAGQSPQTVARNALRTSWKTIFNGNGYDPANQAALTAAGVWRIDSGVDAICRYTADKNVRLFERMGVLNAKECAARQSVLLNHYVGTVEIEALCLIDMINQRILPAVKTSAVGPVDELYRAVEAVRRGLEAVHHETDEEQRARLARTLRLDIMMDARKSCDAAEAVVPAHLWPIATYKDLLFLDQNL